MELTINKTIGIGDGGLPFFLSIDVEYEIEWSQIIVTYCIEKECPYDNPPESWYNRIEEIVSDYFFNEYPYTDVIFKT